MSSFDPPLSRGTAALLAICALIVCAWVLYVAHTTATPKPTVSTVEAPQP